MQGVSGRKAVGRSDQFLGRPDFRHPIGQDLIDYPVQAIEGGFYGFQTPYRRVSVKYLLVDFHVSDKPFACAHKLGKKCHCTILVRMRCAYQVHGDVGVYENHAEGSGGSLSFSIVSIFAVGN